jgi:hypothetical protein
MPHGAFSLFRRDILGGARFLARGSKTAVKLAK